MTLHGADLMRWARAEAFNWWEQRHSADRPPLEEVIAAAYLKGAIAGLNDETVRIRQEGERSQRVQLSEIEARGR